MYSQVWAGGCWGFSTGGQHVSTIQHFNLPLVGPSERLVALLGEPGGEQDSRDIDLDGVGTGGAIGNLRGNENIGHCAVWMEMGRYPGTVITLATDCYVTV